MSAITLEHIEAKQSEIQQLIAKFKAEQPRTLIVPADSIKLANGEHYAGLVLRADGMQLKKISFLDVVFEGDNAGNQRADEFDANVAIFTGEMSELLPDLFEALGGEQVMGCAA